MLYKVNDASSDEALLKRMVLGDKLACQVFYGRYHVRVFRYVVRMVRNEATAEDIISDVFLDVWRQAAQFEGRSSVSTWVLGIARFKALSKLRRRSEAELDEGYAEQIIDDTDTPDIDLQKKDKGFLIRACINKLTNDHREIIDLVYYHEKSIEDVAELLHIPENTVKTRMFYARQKLSEILKAAGIDRGWP